MSMSYDITNTIAQRVKRGILTLDEGADLLSDIRSDLEWDWGEEATHENYKQQIQEHLSLIPEDTPNDNER